MEQQQSASPSERKLRLLVVEDDRATATALRAIFSHLGYEVSVARTVAEALERLDPAPDGIVLDLMLPDGDGLLVLRQVRQRHLPTRVAITTGTSDTLRLDAAMLLQPDLVLRKPIDLSELMRGLDAT